MRHDAQRTLGMQMLLPTSSECAGYGELVNFGPLKRALDLWESRRNPGAPRGWQQNRGAKLPPTPPKTPKLKPMTAEETVAKHAAQAQRRKEYDARKRREATERRWALMTPEAAAADRARTEKILATKAALAAGMTEAEYKEHRRASNRASYANCKHRYSRGHARSRK